MKKKLSQKTSRSSIYAKDVPDVHDGLTSLQREILAKIQKVTVDGKRVKTASIIASLEGEHIFSDFLPRGAFGVSAKIYDNILNMVQDWKTPTLIQGGGCFGSGGYCYGDFANPRYNEIKLSEYANFLFDTKNQTLDQNANAFFSYLPNVLISGTEGTMSNIPPHNLGEVIDALVALINDPNLSDDELLSYIKGPDYINGGIIINKSELAQLYKTGVGNIYVRGKVDVKNDETGHPHLIINELPFTLIPEFKCIGMHNNIKNLNDIILDEFHLLYNVMKIENHTNGDTVCIDISLGKKSNIQKALDALFLYSHVEGVFEYRAILLSNGNPKLMSLYEILSEWLEFFRQKSTEFNNNSPLSENEIISNLLNIKAKFATPRKTQIIDI